MTQIMPAEELLSEARKLLTDLGEGDDALMPLVSRVRNLASALRAVQSEGGIKNGLTMLEPSYHKAVEVYDVEVVLRFFDYLDITETNPIGYDRGMVSLAK